MNQLTNTARPNMTSAMATNSVTYLYGTRFVVPRSGPPTSTMPSAPVDIEAALDLCEQITRSHAPSLYAELKALPAYKRRALCAICAFVHRLSEIADADLHPVEKLELLAGARATIPRDGSTRPTEPVLVALRDTHRRFGLPLESLDDLIDELNAIACEATYETFEDLVMHGRLVAGSVGRLAVAVLGSRDPAAAAARAEDLAVAIWLTEILTDGGERRESGWGEGMLNGDRLRRTRELVDQGLALIPLLDARGAAFINAIARRCARLLDGSGIEMGRIEQPEPVTPRDELGDISITYTRRRWSRGQRAASSLAYAYPSRWWRLGGWVSP